MKKKILSFLTLLFMAAALLPANMLTVSAYNNYLHYKFESNGEVTITECDSSATTIEIPSEINGKKVTSIGESAFFDCESLTSITIPDSVTSIGSTAFYGCSKLTSINVEENNVSYCSIDGNLFNKAKTELIQYAVGKDDTEYAIPVGVTSIGDSAFRDCECYSLTSITIPNSVTSIGERAFCECYSLASITIPNSVTSIGDHAFGWCYNLKTVYYKGNKSEWNNIDIEEYGNSYLEDAEIIYLKQTNLNISKEGNTITVKPVNIESGNVVILALYNEKGLVEMQKKPYTGEDITFPVSKTYTLAKVMVWDSLESMKPICASETVD